MTVLELAYDRGFRRSTFATADELRTPGYDEAWQRGRQTRLEQEAEDEGERAQAEHECSLHPRERW